MNNRQEPGTSPGAPMTGEVAGQVAVGRFVLLVGDPAGAVVREASRSERAHVHPRPTPLLVRPRLIRRLFDRRLEIAAALSALDAGLPIEVSGEPGVGKTAILRHLAHHPRATAFADGVVYIRARHQPLDDLLQRIFDAFYESDEISKPTDSEIRRALHEKQALILLDDVQLNQHELEEVLDIAPQSAFAVATRDRCLWGEVRSLALKGLSIEDAVLLLERELEHALDGAERAAAVSLCAALGGHPVRILQAAALSRDHGIPIERYARSLTPATLIAELMASIDDRQRRALLALTALPGVPLTAQHVSAIAELPDIEPALRMLVHRGLVGGSQSRHRLADGVADQLRRTEDLKPWVNRAITYFTSWAERYRRTPDRLLEESEALMAVQQYAVEARRWGEALRVGRLLEGALATGGRWGAWLISLERCLAAGKALSDRSVEAWALHQIGTRAVCVGEQGIARAALSHAVALRESIDDRAAADISRQNLSLVLAPVVDDAASTPFADVADLEAPVLRSDTWSAAQVPVKHGFGSTLITAFQLVAAAALAFLATLAALSWDTWDTTRLNALLHGNTEESSTTTAASPPLQAATPLPEPAPLQAAADLHAPPRPAKPQPLTASAPSRTLERASILIFTPRPGSFVSDGPTRLCYAVSNAVQARVEPGVGEVPATSTLTCVRVAPVRTTTYELSAFGRDGSAVRQQLVIVR